MSEIELRLAKVEQELNELKEKILYPEKICNHQFEEVGGLNSNYRLYFNGGNCYIQCIKCGYKERA